MKSLDEYILMVVFKLSLNRVHVCANFTFICTKKQLTMKELSQKTSHGHTLQVAPDSSGFGSCV